MIEIPKTAHLSIKDCKVEDQRRPVCYSYHVNERALEIKVGIFILAAIAILVVFALIIGDVSLGGGWKLKVEYGFAGSIHAGAPVRVSGMQIGRVARVDLIEDGRRDPSGRPLLVSLTLELEERAHGILREDTQFHIGTAGILGETYVDAITDKMEGAPLTPDHTVRGNDPPRTDLLLARTYSFVEILSSIIEEDSDTARDLLASLTGLARSLDSFLSENPDQLFSSLKHLDSVLEDLSFISSAARKQMDGGDLVELISRGRQTITHIQSDLPNILESLKKTSETLESIGSLASHLDKDDINQVRNTLAGYEKTGKRLDELTTSLQSIVERIDKGEGTIGSLLNDDEIYEDLRILLNDLRSHPWKLLWRR